MSCQQNWCFIQANLSRSDSYIGKQGAGLTLGAYMSPPNSPAAKFASKSDAHVRTNTQIKFLYCSLAKSARNFSKCCIKKQTRQFSPKSTVDLTPIQNLIKQYKLHLVPLVNMLDIFLKFLLFLLLCSSLELCSCFSN